MKKTILAVIFSLVASGAVFANDDDAPLVSEPLAVAGPGQSCPPPPPMDSCPAPVAPACPAPAKAPAVYKVEEVYHAVPFKKKILVDEEYTVNVTRVESAKEVKKKLIKPNSPRLARVAKKADPVVVHKDVHHEVTYLKPIKIKTVEPVTRTRKVVHEVEDHRLVVEKRLVPVQ